MALDINLMGLGTAPLLAALTANGGTGPILIKAAGSSTTTGTQIGGRQFVVFINSGSGWVTLPAVGSAPTDVAPTVADDFVIHNGLTTSVTVGIPTGVTVNIGGSNLTGNFTITTAKTFTGWVVSSTQWFGITA